MKFILGKKQHMVQYFDVDGRVVPATLVSAGPIVVTQIKNKDTDGYSAFQFGFESQKEKRANKAHLGHVKTGAYKHLHEFRDTGLDLNLGDKVDASVFAKGDVVVVSGISKGKGFQSVIKRHGFHGGPRSHGQKHSEREPGSIGGGLRNRVPKGMRMAGRTGGDRITIKNLKIVEVDADNNQLLIKGAIPGRRGTLIEIVG
ncbi:50S ribosomal protein L3 [Candidatus Nomurabacteria bacterium]|nr:50S ribosomal protein L3 [Candidatus Nomurabacteria bacterium]